MIQILANDKINRRCFKCGTNVKHKVSNLYDCQNCGLIFMNTPYSKQKISLVDTDLRKIYINTNITWRKEIELELYQLDLLRIAQILKSQSVFYYNLFLHFIERIDKETKVNTDFKRMENLPKINLKQYLITNKEEDIN